MTKNNNKITKIDKSIYNKLLPNQKKIWLWLGFKKKNKGFILNL